MSELSLLPKLHREMGVRVRGKTYWRRVIYRLKSYDMLGWRRVTRVIDSYTQGILSFDTLFTMSTKVSGACSKQVQLLIIILATIL